MMNNQWDIKRDKQLAKQNKEDKQAFQESERIESNDTFKEWKKCFKGMVKK